MDKFQLDLKNNDRDIGNLNANIDPTKSLYFESGSIATINSEPAIGKNLIANPECAKTYIDDNFRIIGQARSSFHLSVLEPVYIKTPNPVLCRQKEFVFALGLFK